MSNSLYFNHILPSGLAVITPPSSEPVSTDEAKLWIRQEADFLADDDLIDSLVSTARIYAEAYQKRTLMPTTYKYVLDQFPGFGLSWSPVGSSIFLPLPKLQSVTSVVYLDQSGSTITLDPSRYIVDAVSQPARITPTYAQPWPVVRPIVASVQITYVAGYADASHVPANTKTAIKLLVAHWYRNREAVGSVGPELEFAVTALLSLDKVGSLY